MAVQVEQLLRLQEIDSRLTRLGRERAQLDDGASLKQNLDEITTAADAAEERLHQLHADQVNAELEQKTVEEKKTAMSKKLYDGKVTNPKELSSMEQEIEMFGRQRGRLDERILGLMEEIETATAELERLKAEKAAAASAWETQAALYKKEMSRINSEGSKLTPERQKVAATIEPATLRRYDETRRRSGGGVAAARVTEGRCGACRVSLPQVLVREATEGQKYAACENCSSLLFAPAT